MALRIEDYAMIGDTKTAALVGKNGSIDWLCAPRFDSPAFFAALLGTEANGCWQIGPVGALRRAERRYRQGTVILETDFETDTGMVRLVDCMSIDSEQTTIVRVIEGVRGDVEMQMRFLPRFDYGRLIPLIGRIDQGIFAIAGTDALCLRSRVALNEDGKGASATVTASEGEQVSFQLVYYPSHLPCPEPVDALDVLTCTNAWWREWSGRCTYEGPHRDDVLRSLITLKALTYAPTGAIVAALTTSLPEEIGGERNWDYRFCWLRDGAFTLGQFVRAGYLEEAAAFRDWFLRAIAGDPNQLQLKYRICA